MPNERTRLQHELQEQVVSFADQLDALCGEVSVPVFLRDFESGIQQLQSILELAKQQQKLDNWADLIDARDYVSLNLYLDACVEADKELFQTREHLIGFQSSRTLVEALVLLQEIPTLQRCLQMFQASSIEPDWLQEHFFRLLTTAMLNQAFTSATLLAETAIDWSQLRCPASKLLKKLQRAFHFGWPLPTKAQLQFLLETLLPKAKPYLPIEQLVAPQSVDRLLDVFHEAVSKTADTDTKGIAQYLLQDAPDEFRMFFRRSIGNVDDQLAAELRHEKLEKMALPALQRLATYLYGLPTAQLSKAALIHQLWNSTSALHRDVVRLLLDFRIPKSQWHVYASNPAIVQAAQAGFQLTKAELQKFAQHATPAASVQLRRL